jgi:hypothetical protein
VSKKIKKTQIPKDGLSGIKPTKLKQPHQFSLSSNKHGRVHGFFIDEVFYVVWLDADHLLYSGK